MGWDLVVFKVVRLTQAILHICTRGHIESGWSSLSILAFSSLLPKLILAHKPRCQNFKPSSHCQVHRIWSYKLSWIINLVNILQSLFSLLLQIKEDAKITRHTVTSPNSFCINEISNKFMTIVSQLTSNNTLRKGHKNELHENSNFHFVTSLIQVFYNQINNGYVRTITIPRCNCVWRGVVNIQ